MNDETLFWREKVAHVLDTKLYPQQALLDSSWFVSFAEKRGLRLKSEHLKAWTEMGLIHAFGMNAQFYHPYQIFKLREIVNTVLQSCTFSMFSIPDGLEEIFQKSLEQGKAALKENETFNLKCLYFLILIEDRYLPEIRGERCLLKITKLGFHDGTQSWFDLKKNFDAPSLLQECALSLEEIVEIREHLAFKGWWTDPNRSWLDLTHQISFDQRQQLTGNALLAWDYYEAVEIISHFIFDATGDRSKKGFVLGDWTNVLCNPLLRRDDKKRKEALKKVLAKFVLDARPEVLLIVEGKTEQIYIDAWCKLQKIDLDIYGVQTCYLAGVNGLKHEPIKDRAKAANREAASVIVVADREGDAPQQIQKWLEEGLIKRVFTPADLEGLNHPIGGMVWDKCFEDDNFSQEELLNTWLDMVQRQPKYQIIDREEIQRVARKHFDTAQPEKGYEKPIAYIKALDLTRKELHLPFDKNAITKELCKRHHDSDRPIHKLILHARACAILSANYGLAQPNGGYGVFEENEENEENEN